jgi:L-rhamnose mutarotase
MVGRRNGSECNVPPTNVAPTGEEPARRRAVAAGELAVVGQRLAEPHADGGAERGGQAQWGLRRDASLDVVRQARTAWRLVDAPAPIDPARVQALLRMVRDRIGAEIARRVALGQDGGVERYGFLLRIRPGMRDEYVRRHDALWPEMAEALRRAGARNYSIFFDVDGERLFAYLEAEPDVATYLRRIAADPVNARWQAHMSDLLVSAGDGVDGPVPRLEPAFHLD